MGSPVSPIVCNLYMESFEQKALAGAEDPPRWWKRYVDDTYTVLKKDQSQEFTDYLNTVDDDIKWTTEGEVRTELVCEEEDRKVERTLAFLDTLSVLNEDGTIRTRVYRKETHTDQYLNFSSNHPLEHKRGVVKTLVHRADTVVSDLDERKKELDHIRGALRVNGYPDWMLGESREEVKEKEQTVEEGAGATPPAPEPQVNPQQPERKRKFPVTLPYVKGMSEELRRVFSRYGTPAYFKPTNTLRQLLVRPKDPIEKEKVVGPVYKITCEDCEASYVGETERSLKARFSEHRRPSSVNSEVSKHIHTDCPDHGVQLDKTEILAVEPKWYERGVKEAIYIRANKPSLNRDGGRFNLSPIWNNTLKRRVKGTRAGGARSADLS